MSQIRSRIQRLLFEPHRVVSLERGRLVRIRTGTQRTMADGRSALPGPGDGVKAAWLMPLIV